MSYKSPADCFSIRSPSLIALAGPHYRIATGTHFYRSARLTLRLIVFQTFISLHGSIVRRGLFRRSTR